MDSIQSVEQMIEDFDPGVAHPDFIGIGEKKTNIEPFAAELFPDRIDFLSAEDLRVFKL